MAISPLRQTGFLQQTREKRAGKAIAGFRLRTGQKFGDIARGQLFQQELRQEQIDKQQQARTALAFRQQEQAQALEGRKLEESTRQFGAEQEDRKEREQQQRRGALNEALFGKTLGPIVSAIT